MTMKRRTFFQLLAGAMLAPAVVKLGGPVLPYLAGDGINNDAPALNALLRGEAVEFAPSLQFEGVGWVTPTRLVLPKGEFMLMEPVRMIGQDGNDVDFNGSTLFPGETEEPLEALFIIENCTQTGIFSGTFDPRKRALGCIDVRYPAQGAKHAG
jgi:hypothetical protein